MSHNFTQTKTHFFFFFFFFVKSISIIDGEEGTRSPDAQHQRKLSISEEMGIYFFSPLSLLFFLFFQFFLSQTMTKNLSLLPLHLSLVMDHIALQIRERVGKREKGMVIVKRETEKTQWECFLSFHPLQIILQDSGKG